MIELCIDGTSLEGDLASAALRCVPGKQDSIDTFERLTSFTVRM